MPRQKKTGIDPKKAQKLLRLSTELSDVVEDILEDQGAYKPEFVEGLNISIRQAQAGKLFKIKSLDDLR
jgi:hypothetical protein